MTLQWGYAVTWKQWRIKWNVKDLNENSNKETDIMEENELETGTAEYKAWMGNFTADLARQKSEQRQFSKLTVQRLKRENDHEDSPRNLQIP